MPFVSPLSSLFAPPPHCPPQTHYLQTTLMSRFSERLLKQVADVSRHMPQYSDRPEHAFPHLAGSHLTEVSLGKAGAGSGVCCPMGLRGRAKNRGKRGLHLLLTLAQHC